MFPWFSLKSSDNFPRRPVLEVGCSEGTFEGRWVEAVKASHRRENRNENLATQIEK
jgi:hypothetical protein